MNPTKDGDYNYEVAGFDAFLSRSIDNLPQTSLDSAGPASTATAYDRGQTTGAVGDSFKLGTGIELAGKDNAINLTDGALNVTDTSTGSSLQASSGNISYYDNQGRLVVQEGNLPAGATGIRIVDAQNVGLAQFARDKDGNTALRIAKPNIEVSTATNDQLIFNSSQNTLKIVKTDTLVTTLTNTSNTVAQGVQTITIPHLLNFKPAYTVYLLVPDGLAGISGAQLVALPYNSFVGNNPGLGPFTYFYAYVDESSLYIRFNHGFSTDYSPQTPTYSIRYYLMQETAT